MLTLDSLRAGQPYLLDANGYLKDFCQFSLQKYPAKARLSVVITDPASGRVLLARQLINQPANRHQGELSIRKWRAAGLEKIAVEIICHPIRGDFFTDLLLLNLLASATRP